MGLLDGDLAAAIYNGLNFMLLDGTLRREVTSSVNSYGDPVLSTPLTYSFRGFDDQVDAAYRARTGMPETDMLILIAADSLSVEPNQDDKLYLRSRWHQIRMVSTDPARAVWECQCFRVDAP